MPSDAVTLALAGPGGTERLVRVSNPDRPIWPATDASTAVTKADLVDYLRAVHGPFLAAAGDRPMTLQRFRGGIGGQEFYSKNPPKGMPEWIPTTMCTYPSGRTHPQLVLSEIAAAIWAVQLNTVTFHPWPVRAADTDHVDEVRIDLDPQPGRSFTDVVEVAFALRELMAEIGLIAWVKTSGNRGLHIYSRIAPTREFDYVRHAVIGIARELERRLPALVTTAWWKELRGQRIFIDYNQSCRDRTIAAAYSPRAVPGARVSTPLSWPELASADPADYTVHTLPAVLAERTDPWEHIGAPENLGDLTGAHELWLADAQAGLGELNYPPDYPKMPGEPPRVQPSRQRHSRANAPADSAQERA